MIRSIFGAAFLVAFSSLAYGQASPAASTTTTSATPKRTEVYSITFIHAAAGKASALEEWGKKAGQAGPMPGHGLVLRHEAGAPWDYVTVQYIGAKATVEATGNPQGLALRPLMDWHDDTFVNGPAWADFAKEMDLDDSGKAKSKDSVYVVSVYRPVNGQEDALDKFLNEAPTAGDLTAGNVVMQHLEGGAWRFFGISRYKNYQDYATSEAAAVKEAATGSSTWFKLRDLVSFHNDTVAVHVGQ